MEGQAEMYISNGPGASNHASHNAYCTPCGAINEHSSGAVHAVSALQADLHGGADRYVHQ